MDEQRKSGTVKFYSAEKGFGFIYCQGVPDAFFHVTNVDSPLPPAVGALVSFTLVNDPRTQKLNAVQVRVENDATQAVKSQKHQPKLDGFPCVRGDSIEGFIVQRTFGDVRVGTGWFAPSFSSANSARESLINRARSLGANAVTNYVWHKESVRQKGLFGWYVDTTFWAEGNAVLLVPR